MSTLKIFARPPRTGTIVSEIKTITIGSSATNYANLNDLEWTYASLRVNSDATNHVFTDLRDQNTYNTTYNVDLNFESPQAVMLIKRIISEKSPSPLVSSGGSSGGGGGGDTGSGVSLVQYWY